MWTLFAVQYMIYCFKMGANFMAQLGNANSFSSNQNAQPHITTYLIRMAWLMGVI